MSENRIYSLADSAAQLILKRTSLRPQIALVLGSGLGGFADSLTDAVRVPYADIPAFPRSTAIGHAGQMVIGQVSGNVGEVSVAAMQGRVHLYEGYSPQEVTFPIRVFGRMGIRAVILTNAAGGINLSYSARRAGRDPRPHQSAGIQSAGRPQRRPLRRPLPRHDATPTQKNIAAIAREEAAKLGIPQHEGVYAGLLGPSYETPAEIEYLRSIGADLVGMSTVAEVIAARHMGIKVLAISCVTNMAAGILDQPLSHARSYGNRRARQDHIRGAPTSRPAEN